MSQQRGFTLIELIVVIVILGILAATALPRFIDLSSDARQGVMRGVEGAMRSANVMLYGRASAAGVQNNAGPVNISATVTVPALPVVFGYASTAQNLALVLDLNPPGDFDTTVAGEIRHSRATVPGNCRIQYTPPAAVGGVPTYSATLTGC